MSETTKTPLSFDGEYEWLETLIHYRTQNPDACLMEVGEAHASGISAVPHDAPGEYACFVREHPFDWKTRSLLLMALAPVLRPRSMAKMIGPGNCFRLYQTPEGLYLPTGESWLYLLGGNRVEDRLDLLELLDEQCFLFRENVLVLADVPKHFSSSYGILKAEESWEDRFQFNRLREPSFSPSFPAHRLTAALDWEDLLLNGKTRSELRELMAYFQHEQTLRKDFGLDKHMRRGFRALFHGPSGTGKSLTAALIGKQLRQPVYRVDLSRLVSKYVGETSKNLERLFRKAEGKKWILFFDEGDVLLNKRTGNSAGDSGHYANQEVAYLLQRIEDYDGLVIVATNLRGNLDVAFARRFESFIHFSTPEESVALLLWEKNWPAAVRKGASIDLAEFAGRYPVSAATIVNILKKMSLRLLMNKQRSIELPELEEIADREIRK